MAQYKLRCRDTLRLYGRMPRVTHLATLVESSDLEHPPPPFDAQRWVHKADRPLRVPSRVLVVRRHEHSTLRVERVDQGLALGRPVQHILDQHLYAHSATSFERARVRAERRCANRAGAPCGDSIAAVAGRVHLSVLIRNKSSAGTHRPRRQIFLAVNSSVLLKSPDVISISIGRRLMDSFSAVSLVAVGDVGLELEVSHLFLRAALASLKMSTFGTIFRVTTWVPVCACICLRLTYLADALRKTASARATAKASAPLSTVAQHAWS
jgi:hypothetical protein